MERKPHKNVSENKEHVAEFYNTKQRHRLEEKFTQRIKREIPLTSFTTLDIGCGVGETLLRLAKEFEKMEGLGIDPSKEVLKYATKDAKKAGFEKRVKFLNTGVPNPEIEEKKFDLVVSKSTLHHMEDPEVFFKELKSFTKEGGFIYITDFIRPESDAKVKEIVSLLNASPVVLKEFEESLRAAFSFEEVKEAIKKTGIDLKLERFTDVHFLASGKL